MIKAVNLSKYYQNTPAIKDISFEAQKGEILGFLGPNGAGKTTTMRILTSYLSPTSGKAEIDGLDVSKHSLKVRQLIGYLPENTPLYEDMRVNEYLDFRGALKGLKGKDRSSRLNSVVERCALGDVKRRIIGQLSKGYHQRVALAEAILGDPKVLILDEPTVGLDPHQIRQVRNLIKELGGERTIILSTHILPEAEMICGRVIIINKGELVAVDTPDNLRNRLIGGFTIQLEVRGPADKIKEALSKVSGVNQVMVDKEGDLARFNVNAQSDHDIREELFKVIVAGGWSLRELKYEMASLEDIFVHITTQEKAE